MLCISTCMEKINQVKEEKNYGNVLAILQKFPECSVK